MPSALLSVALITKRFQSCCVKQGPSLHHCSRAILPGCLLSLDRVCMLFLPFSHRERKDKASLSPLYERCTDLPCQARGCPASTLGGCQPLRCGEPGDGAEIGLLRTCLGTCLQLVGNLDRDW